MSNNSKQYSAARQCYVGAKVFNLVSTMVDNGHKSKGNDLRIEKPARLFTIKSTKINEVKLQAVAGGIEVLVINGGPDALKIPANYKFTNDMRDFNEENNTESNPVFFGDYKVAKDIANAANEAEIIRLTAIIKDLEAQRQALKDASAANEDAIAIHCIEKED